MTETEFNRIHKATGRRLSRTVKAVRLVLVDGLTGYSAAKRVGLSQGAVYVALAKFPRDVCSECGQAIKKPAG